MSTAAAQASLDDDGFALETQVLEQLVRKWGDFADHYREAIRAARDIASAQEPGLDFASVGHAEKVRASGAELQLALEERLGYCVDMRDRLRAALGGYVGAEDEAAAETARMGALE
ncbi:hypothetical protein FFT09_10020 [Saccharomonospora piscinae]|nr:hypothetical protein FFT09_10020 [Saccharomonospora piscinae]